ncbi:hypothetical protein IQ267_22430 [filamentous cyanobacterium LEGE 07170]|nr:hypothetical protein [filamentous cyanobacterium LEGE 07170]
MSINPNNVSHMRVDETCLKPSRKGAVLVNEPAIPVLKSEDKQRTSRQEALLL